MISIIGGSGFVGTRLISLYQGLGCLNFDKNPSAFFPEISSKCDIRDRSSFTNLDDCVRITIGSKKQIIRVLDVLSN